MREPEVALAASPRDWAQRLLRHVVDHGGASVRLTALGVADVLAEQIDVFVADDTTSFLTPRLVAALHARDVCVLGVFDDQDPRGRGELIELGVDDVIVRTASAELFVEVIAGLAAPAARLGDGSDGAAEPLEAAAQGTVLAVGAASGGCGATEVALAAAVALARRRLRALLVDADEVGPAVAQRLGLAPLPNLRTAVDSVERRDGRLLDALAVADEGRLAVLVGLESGRDWAELRAGEVQAVLSDLVTVATHVLVNVGPMLEDLVSAGGPPRFAVTRGVLARADAVVGVGLPTPVGVGRLLRWCADVRVLAPTAPVHLALNRTTGSGFQRSEVERELLRAFPAASVTFLPLDERVGRAAWAGEPVPDGPFLQAVVTLLAEAVPDAAAGRRRRGRRVR